MQLEIVYLSPHALKPYENNTRKHSPEDIDQIKASIAADGFNDPIGIWGDQNIIVEGHGRQIAAIEMGLDKVPCIRLDHMTEVQRRDYAIRHNRTAELSAWDFGKLEEEIARLEIDGIDLSGLKLDALNIASDRENIPENLDGDDYDGNGPIGCKFTFSHYGEYNQHENELKEFAESIGAVFSVVKA